MAGAGSRPGVGTRELDQLEKLESDTKEPRILPFPSTRWTLPTLSRRFKLGTGDKIGYLRHFGD